MNNTVKKKVTGNTTVTTVGGLKVPRSQCRRIKGKYYIPGDITKKDSGECYLLDGLYYRHDNKFVEYDHQQEKYVLSHKIALLNGVVDVDSKGNFVYGYFSSSLSDNVVLWLAEEDKKVICLNEDIAKKAKYRERYYNGIFYDRTSAKANWFRKIMDSPVNKNNYEYDSRYVSSSTQEEYDKKYNPTCDNKYMNAFGNFLEKNGITFGVEFETTKGFIPERLCYKYGLIPLRDGSIDGLEYVTVVYSGKKGLYALKEVCELLSKRTENNYSCALHLHVAGVERTKGSIMSTILLGLLCEDEQFLLQPPFKKGLPERKEYCQKLSKYFNISKLYNSSNIFDSIFSFISDGRSFDAYLNDLKRVDTHPSDPSGERKWQIRSRYFWLNMVPLVFGNKKTIEFRHNSITNNFSKVFHMLFFCALFVWTVKNRNKDLVNKDSKFVSNLIAKPSNTVGILVDYFKKEESFLMSVIANSHVEYTKLRKKVMADITSKKDIYGKTEKTYDKEFEEIFKEITK